MCMCVCVCVCVCLCVCVCASMCACLWCSPLSDSGFAAAYYSSQTSPTDEASICFCPGCFCTSMCPLWTPTQSSPRPKETFPVLFLTLILLRLPVCEWYALVDAQMFKSSQVKCVCLPVCPMMQWFLISTSKKVVVTALLLLLMYQIVGKCQAATPRFEPEPVSASASM